MNNTVQFTKVYRPFRLVTDHTQEAEIIDLATVRANAKNKRAARIERNRRDHNRDQ